MTIETREEWLSVMTCCLRDRFRDAGAEIPQKIQFSCGWPSARGLSQNNRVLGQCWAAEASEDGSVEVFVSPVVGDGVEAAAVLVHELVHASGIKGHAGPFKRIAVALGLEGPMRASHAGQALRDELAQVVAAIGPYPHAALGGEVADDKPKKQGTRMIKVECPRQTCKYVVRTTAKWIEVGLPTCPCGELMAVAETETE